MGLNPGIGYTGANLGSVYGLNIDQSIDWLTRNVGRQFECSLSGEKVGEESKYYLQVRKGLVEFDYYGTDDKGIIDLDNLGGFNGTNTQNMFFYLNKYNVFQTGKRVTGDHNDKSDFVSDGYIELEKEKNYFVFIYKTTPDWQQEGTLYEARAPQLGVAADDSEPNIFIKTQRNGGGFLQSYIKLSGGGTVENIVTADPLSGKIGTFDAAELNDAINLNLDLLDIVRSEGQGANHPDRYPSAMATWIGEGFVPVFANPSTLPQNPNDLPNGMTLFSVPNLVHTEIVLEDNNNNDVIVPSWGAVGSDIFLYNDVIVGWNVGTKYGYTENPIVSGLLNYNDLTIVAHNDAPPADIVYFDNTDIDLIASSQTSITTVGTMTDEGTGYVTTDCYRQDIAYIKWDASLNRFKIYQLQYGPIKLRQNPCGSFKNKLLTGEEIAQWDSGFDLCQYITGSFSGYTKDLNQSTSGTQPPVYAGYENIGNYQSPKETL